jgi:flagellar L-ring protein precursor FlgH
VKARIVLALIVANVAWAEKRRKPAPLTPLDEYVAAARAGSSTTEASPGSLYSNGSRFSDLARDLRAAQAGDLVTILVNDRASAVTNGATSASRSSSASASIPELAGPRLGPVWQNLARLGSEFNLEGQGATSRSSTLTATLTARVVEVLPNGYLVLEGSKDVQANSERQKIVVRGVARWNDIGPGNTLRSDRLGQMEIRIDGKGVVADAIRRPNLLYRILLGILPF